MYVYCLKLQSGKYYIGKTNNPEFRLDNHFSRKGSYWTKKYPPIEIVEMIPNCDDWDEDKYTLKYMEQFGIDNVRGGSFCQFTLSKENLLTINQMITGSTDRCYICDEFGHFANSCPNRVDSKKSKVMNFLKKMLMFCGEVCMVENELYDDSFEDSYEPPPFLPGKCYQCGRSGHFIKDCYAKTHVKGYKL